MTSDLVPLDEGPAAMVLAGVDEASGQAFALKVYSGKLDRQTRAELDKELAAVRALQGPVVVPDAVEEMPDGRCAVRMELCAQSLTELVESFGPLPVPDALALGEMIASTLAAAHRAGIVHGGVTPGNVLFRASGEAVLADFGLTLRQAFPAAPERIVDFVAPETLRDGTADERSDLYGLGVTLYVALTGVSPHQGRPGEQHGDRVLRVLSSEVPELERTDVPAGLVQLVSALLAKNPDARPLDATVVATRLGAMIGPTAPAPRPLGDPIVVFGPQEKKRRAPRSGLMIAVVAAVLAVLAVVAVLLLVNSPTELNLPTAGTQSASPQTPNVRIELADPVDGGSFAELSWRSNVPLDFWVRITADGQSGSTPQNVLRSTSTRVPVDPTRKYCFLVEGSDSRRIYHSQSKSFRGGTCPR
jgi:serine/threonine protein kinase